MTSGLRDGVWRPRPARALFAAGHQARAALAARRHWATERQASWNLAESAGCLGPLRGLGRGAMGRPTARFGAVGIFLEKVEKRVYIASMSLRLVIILRPQNRVRVAAGTHRYACVAAARLSQAITCRRSERLHAIDEQAPLRSCSIRKLSLADARAHSARRRESSRQPQQSLDDI